MLTYKLWPIITVLDILNQSAYQKNGEKMRKQKSPFY